MDTFGAGEGALLQCSLPFYLGSKTCFRFSLRALVSHMEERAAKERGG